ncbi:MAG: amidohydrolase [Christensenellales bacterium]
MKYRFYNAKILTAEHGIIDGEMWVEEGKITFLSPCSPLILKPWDREMDMHGNLVMPPFKDAHAHSPMTFLRSFADDLPLKKWLFDKVFPYEAQLCGDDCYWLSRLAILEYLSGGISAVSDMYFYLDEIAQAFVDSGIRNVIMEGITQSNGPKDKMWERLDKGRKNLDGKGGLIEYRLGLHAEYTNDIDNIEAFAEYAKVNKLPVCMHISETRSEVDNCIKKYGKSPIKLMSDIGMFDNGATLYHCVHIDDEDMDVIARAGASVVSCPASNLKLASGIAPLEKLRAKGVNIGLGTDGAASNNSLDMLRETYLATTLQKYICNDASALPADVVLEMATKGSAKAMGLKELDGLYVGAQADLCVINLNKPNMRPYNNVIKNVVYAANKSDVLMTMVAGVIRYENGEFFVGESVDKIYAMAEKITNRIKNR